MGKCKRKMNPLRITKKQKAKGDRDSTRLQCLDRSGDLDYDDMLLNPAELNANILLANEV